MYGDSFKICCEEPINFPLGQPSSWLLSRLIVDHNIPKFAEKDFSDALFAFLRENEKTRVDDCLTCLYSSLLKSENEPGRIADLLEKRVNERISTRFQSDPPTDEEIFGQTYTKIVKSPAAMDLIQLEHSFAVAVETEVIERNRILNELQREIVNSTEAMLSKNNEEIDVEEAVSSLQRRFHTEYEVQKMTLNSRISDLKETQRKDYRNFVMSVGEQILQVDLSRPLPLRPSELSSDILAHSTPNRTVNPSNVTGPRSESFMIQLGRQLRSFYNLKLVEADPMDLLTPIGSSLGTSTSPQSVEATVNLAERLSSALTIYSNELTGLVILVDSQIFQSRDQQRLAEVCEMSTDFHFPELDRQLFEMKEAVRDLPDSDLLSRESSVQETSPVSTPKSHPKPGDVYLTRHSNLRAGEIGGNAGGGGGVEVVFHVVADDVCAVAKENLESPASPSLPSYLHAALSTVLRVCSQHDITTLSLPLFFTRRSLESVEVVYLNAKGDYIVFLIVFPKNSTVVGVEDCFISLS
ncbi:unnamed protein product [Hymenolepis diminuta]|uniref:LisH domain-containing protein n=1 Tax=Hymenolepis diminuta TaxID=6216 RepID=A0A0R3SFK0_HYMDI|nr:unnamed protein product [Hymenolepis diminuta]